MVVDGLVAGSVGFVVVVVFEVVISCGLTVFALVFSLLLSPVSLLFNFTVLFESVEIPIEYFLVTEILKGFFQSAGSAIPSYSVSLLIGEFFQARKYCTFNLMSLCVSCHLAKLTTCDGDIFVV